MLTSSRGLAAVVALVWLGAGCNPQPDVDPGAEPEAGSGEAEDLGPPDEPEEPDEADDVPPPEHEPDPELGIHAVSAGDQAAIDAGHAVFEAGGSALDATIAAAFAISVVEPFASGLGGGGAALVAVPGQEPEAYDYREVVADDGVVPSSNTGIPGFVAGMRALHDDHGVLDWDQLLAPAIALAGEGTATTTIVADQLRSAAHRLPAGELPTFFPEGAALREGDPLVQPELAATLQQLADEGPDGFYTGVLAEELATSVEGIDAASLASYSVQRDPPARGAFGAYDVVAPAPALPGPTFIQQLQLAEALGVGDLAPDDPDAIHRTLMAWRIADASISEQLGDPAFVEVPVGALTDPERNAAIAAEVPDDALVDPGALDVAAGDADVGSTGNTTHLTVVGSDGTVVSMTNTLTNFWGSGEQVMGFFLNDQLRRFSIGGESTNTAEPGRRSVSWGLPILVLDASDRPVLGAGSPGGRRIPTILTGLLVRWGLHGERLQAAVDAPRVHLEDEVVEFEQLPSDEVLDDLLARGYAGAEEPAPVYYFGSVQALEIDHDARSVTGATDPRRQGTWEARSVDQTVDGTPTG